MNARSLLGPYRKPASRPPLPRRLRWILKRQRRAFDRDTARLMALWAEADAQAAARRQPDG